ncbi:hypothetical protein HYW99_04025, partial [Candidatus Woesearchaeota archaeon]|nr:hypothetical protein [Candidatus Woesearchaeota archaeon]
MKKLILFFIIMISIPSVLANWFYNSENIIVNININSYADIITSQNGYIEDATINLTFFPKQTEAQELSNFYTIPKAEAIDKSLIFTWKRPYDKLEFKLNADVKTTNSILKIRDKIRFPIENLPDDVIVYTKPSETIDSDKDSIIRMASELVKGEGDLYAAVFK